MADAYWERSLFLFVQHHFFYTLLLCLPYSLRQSYPTTSVYNHLWRLRFPFPTRALPRTSARIFCTPPASSVATVKRPFILFAQDIRHADTASSAPLRSFALLAFALALASPSQLAGWRAVLVWPTSLCLYSDEASLPNPKHSSVVSSAPYLLSQASNLSTRRYTGPVLLPLTQLTAKSPAAATYDSPHITATFSKQYYSIESKHARFKT